MANFVTREKLFTKRWFRAYSYILLGTFTMATGYVYFITPHKIVPGGIYGISIILHHLISAPMGTIALFFNIPLTIIGLKILGPRFGIKTIIGFFSAAFFIDVLTYFSKGKPLVADDILLSSIFGGVLIGAGVGFLFKSRATCGGTDVVGMILGKYTRLPVSKLMIAVDSVIVVLGLLAFRKWELAFYSWIVLFIMGKVIDIVLNGFGYDKTLFIVSEHYEEIRNKLINDMSRGGTFMSGKGMYNGSDRQVIYTTVSLREVEILKDYIREIDPKAFVTVIDANEVLGQGFKSLNENAE